MSAAPTAADLAVDHVLRRIRDDGRVAWFLGFGTESFALLTAAFAERHGLDVEQYRREFAASLNPVRMILAKD
jgi:hypothetical protein